MKKKLFKNKKIEVRQSHIHGYGVFANKSIKSGEILEECNYVEVSAAENNLSHYAYHWPDPIQCAFVKQKTTMPFGYACTYNSSDSKEESNAYWECDIKNDIYIFKARKNIKAGEEILIYYGGGYWGKWNKQLWHQNCILIVDNLITPEMHKDILNASKSPLHETIPGGIYEKSLEESKIACDNAVTVIRKSKLTIPYQSRCLELLDDFGQFESTNLTYNTPKKYKGKTPLRDGVYYMTYDKDQHFDWHIDAKLDVESCQETAPWLNWRCWTATTFLNDDYEGGVFEISDIQRNIAKIKPKKYRTVIFRSFLNHKVTPVISGVRKQLVHWIHTENTYIEQEKEVSKLIRDIYNKGNQ
tara:strand:+ start:1252 stop:2322 length:1071 start_codon:yes stop_codon:yes gene_type:complete